MLVSHIAMQDVKCEEKNYLKRIKLFKLVT
jgi:hypothetical protein